MPEVYHGIAGMDRGPRPLDGLAASRRRRLSREETHDVIVPWDDGRFLVYGTT